MVAPHSLHVWGRVGDIGYVDRVFYKSLNFSAFYSANYPFLYFNFKFYRIIVINKRYSCCYKTEIVALQINCNFFVLKFIWDKLFNYIWLNDIQVFAEKPE